jgi:hypothetical protein
VRAMEVTRAEARETWKQGSAASRLIYMAACRVLPLVARLTRPGPG